MDETIGATAEARDTPSGIPLALAPLLSPYRRHGHLSLRLERLPERARLSRGSNNGDRTWSLTVDDLEDLTYLPPEGRHEAHTLALRIVSLDGDDGATLAVLDVPVPSGNALSGPSAGAVATPDGEAGADRGIELRRLHDECAMLKASLSTREAELAQTRRQLDHARGEASDQAIEAQLTAARAAWAGELSDRLAKAAAEAAASLEQNHAAWQAEEAGRLATIAARAEERIGEARERWQQEADAALSSAETRWKADEAARLAAAEARWREAPVPVLAAATARVAQAEAALAQARAEVETDAIELRRLRDELAEVKACLSAREAELIEAWHKLDHASAEGSRQAEQRWQEEARASLAKAEADWKAGEALRLAAAEAQWLEEVAPALAEAEARLDAADAASAKARAQAQGDDVELHFLREELQEVKTSLALREAELAEARSTAAQLRQARRANVGQLHLAERLLSGSIEAQQDAADADAGGTRARAPAARDRPRTGRRLLGVGALLLAAAMAVMVYPRVAQTFREGLRSEILPPSTKGEPSVRNSEPPANRSRRNRRRSRSGARSLACPTQSCEPLPRPRLR